MKTSLKEIDYFVAWILFFLAATIGGAIAGGIAGGSKATGATQCEIAASGAAALQMDGNHEGTKKHEDGRNGNHEGHQDHQDGRKTLVKGRRPEEIGRSSATSSDERNHKGHQEHQDGRTKIL